ncbi:MAG TPA: hypothetical protein ENK19_06195 [Acidobacteria bacterium]|nr:hypothetical protein [Acidobacteriota bacterium]
MARRACRGPGTDPGMRRRTARGAAPSSRSAGHGAAAPSDGGRGPFRGQRRGHARERVPPARRRWMAVVVHTPRLGARSQGAAARHDGGGTVHPHRRARVGGADPRPAQLGGGAAGGDAELAVRLAQIFQWDIDFFRDLRKGDRFVVVADRRTVDGRPYGWGELYAARFVNGGRTLTAIAFPDENGRIGYYDLEGRPLRKEFLRAPLKFSRITSRFSLHRYHPILHRRMPHYGVDYGAPVGTPVHVTADGVVRFVGRKGGAGKMISVRHTNGYETNYLHLSRYGRGIHRGVRVRQGQVIGYVGQTGMATGPHLDYRVRHNGRWINPLRIASPPARPLAKKRLARFLSYAITVQALLDGKEPPRGAMG